MVELYRYAAFISYSSKDARFAKRLHRALESYGIPSSLGKFDLLGAGGKKNRIYPVFRDREELSAGDLGELIQANLKVSGALIVICSPNAAASPWVQNEIEHFVGLGRRDRIFAIIADAAPLRDAAGADATPTSFPPAFRGDALVDPKALEPLAADARKGKDGFRNAWLKIVAGLVGVTPGQLIDRDRKRRRQRASQIFAIGLLVGVGVATAASVYATSAWRGELTTAALELSSSGSYLDSLPLAIAGEGGRATLNPGRIARTDEALLKVWSPAATRLVGAPKYFTFSRDSRFVGGGQKDGSIEIHDLNPAFTRRDTSDWGSINNYVFSSNGRFVLTVTKADELVLHDIETGGPPVDLGQFEGLDMITVSADGGTVVVKDFDNDGYILAVSGWKRSALGDLGDTDGIGDDEDYFRLSADGRFLVTSGNSSPTEFRDLGNGAAVTELGADASSWMTADGKKLFLKGDDNAYTVYDLTQGLAPKRLAFMDQFAEAHPGTFTGIALSADGSTVLATAGATDAPGAAVFDLASGQKLADMADDKKAGFFDLSGDGRTILRHLPDNLFDLYDVRTGKVIAPVGNIGQWLRAGIAADGRTAMLADMRGIGLVAEAGHVAPEADRLKKGGALADAVCAFNSSTVLPLAAEIRQAGEAEGVNATQRGVQAALRGRPWNPCDWRGFGAILPDKARGDGWFEGPRQWVRLISIRYFSGRDYRCAESNARGTVFARPKRILPPQRRKAAEALSAPRGFFCATCL